MRNKVLLATFLCLLAFFNYSIFAVEQDIKNGRTVFFELAPVDPRSLLQGDYMSLSYEVLNQIPTLYENSEEKISPKTKAQAIIELDENNKAKVISLYNTGMELEKNQILLSFTYENAFSIRTPLTRSYFFQEGNAERFENAKYGVFKYANGKYILTNLADSEFKIIQAQ